MNKSLFFALLFSFAAFGDQLPIVKAIVDTQGIYVSMYVLSMDDSGTYRSGVNLNTPVPDSARVRLTLSSPGFNNSGDSVARTRYLYGKKPKRAEYPKNIDGTLTTYHDTILAGTPDTLVYRYILSEYVYKGDWGLALTCSTGTYSDVDDEVASCSDFSVANQSNLDYPIIAARWSFPGRSVVRDSLRLHLKAYGGISDSSRPAVAIVFTATASRPGGGTVTVKDTINTMSLLDSITYDDPVLVPRKAKDFKPVQEYYCNMPLDSLPQDSLITVNFAAYPWVGNSLSVCNTAVSPDTFQHGRAPQYYLCDKGATYNRVVAVVDSLNGSTTLGKCVLLSEFNPLSPPTAYRSLHLARNAIQTYRDSSTRIEGGNGTASMQAAIIYGKTDKPLSVMGGSTGSKNATHIINCILMPFPGSTDTLRIDTTTAEHDLAWHAQIHNVLFEGDGALSAFEQNTCWWSCSRIRRATSPPISTPSSGTNTTGHFTHCKFDSTNVSTFRALSTRMLAYGVIRGNDIDSCGITMASVVCGNYYSRSTGGFIDQYTAQTTPVLHTVIIADNYINLRSSSITLADAATADHTSTQGCHAIVNNVIANIRYTASPIMAIGRNNTSANTVDNIILANNTYDGQRANLAYNDNVLMTVSAPAWRRNWFFHGNINTELNIVTGKDTHGGTPDAQLYGNTGPKNAVGGNYDFQPENREGTTAQNGFEVAANRGRAAMYGESIINPLFAKQLNLPTDTAQSGWSWKTPDLRLKNGSPAIGYNKVPYTPWDLRGWARRWGGAVGPYESHDTLCRTYGTGITEYNQVVTAPCSTLSKNAGDSITVYLETSTNHTSWTKQDSTAQVYAATRDTLTTGTLNPSTTYYVRLRGVTSGYLGAYGDTLTLDTIATDPLGPVVTAQPVNDTAIVGQSAAFSVTATGTGTLHYQWYHADETVIDGATASNYTISAVTAGQDESEYFVEITDDIGSSRSDTVMLIVQIPPTVTVGPADVRRIAGETAQFTVTATGDPTIAYQWQKNGVDVGTDSDTYTTGALSISDSGALVRCVVSNTYGADTSGNAFIRVRSLPVISEQPTAQTENDFAPFEFSVTATRTTSYQWYLDGVGTSMLYTYSGTATYADSGKEVWCILTNDTGSISTDTVLLHVNPIAPFVTSHPGNKKVKIGSTATFSASFGGTQTIVYQWYADDIAIPLAVSQSYTKVNCQPIDSGVVFTCEGINAWGRDTTNGATLRVLNHLPRAGGSGVTTGRNIEISIP
jgi:hypothetical protein